MNYYDELREIATELRGAGWYSYEKEDILRQHGDDLPALTEYDWQRVFDIMEDLEVEA